METTRTIFSKPNPADYEDLLSLYTNKSVRKYLGGPVTKAKFDDKFADFFSTKSPECYWIVRQKDTNQFIGMVYITIYHDKLHYEISYQLHPEFWGKGYGSETVQKTIDYAFQELKLKELYAETQKKNLQSIKLLEKLGFELLQEEQRYGEIQSIYTKTNTLPNIG